VEDLEPYLNQKMICEVTQVERGDKNIVVSRRNVLLKEREEMKEHAWEELQEGQTRHGVVRSLMEYGAFVDIGGLDGLLHVKEMSWAHVKHPKDILTVGQGIDVIVVSVDREKNRVGLSLRQAGGDPWTRVEIQYPIGSQHQAQIKNLADFGAFAELEPGIEGLIPISQMSWAGRIKHPSDVVKPGQFVNVEIMSVDLPKKRMSLSMKKMLDNPWSNIDAKYKVEQICTGTVARLTDFGAFITLEPGIDGLVHVSEIANHRVNRPGDVIKEGQDVQVKILNIDKDNRRIGLTIKGAEIMGVSAVSGSMSEPEAVAAEPDKSAKNSKKNADRPRRGGLTW
jgi:small subunit ribosomal protein S1